MFYHQDSDLEPVTYTSYKIHQLLTLLRVHARRRFVEQQQLRAGREGARYLQPPLRAVWQPGGDLTRKLVKPHRLKQLHGTLAYLALLAAEYRQVERRAPPGSLLPYPAGGHDILQHGAAGKEADVLEGARDAGLADDMRLQRRDILAVEDHASGGRLIEAGDYIETGGLTRAVGADQARYRAPFNLYCKAADGGEAAELDHDVLGLQYRISHLRAPPFP